ncbi:pentalenic acid synthase [Lipingzhangella halophila]|uniref:Pentalenic acid synthase n=1 Tax=Lipingzhangella halophila TaxID=1783352 RepID=A0A7W7RDZ0_9ACTN|nr:cytochrome P450 [Lipingzhangella halophila]MBB4930205.1 pentalenic acid synthase [Lipingzhangella halophila]
MTDSMARPATDQSSLELPLRRQCPMAPPPEYEDLRTNGPTRVRTPDGTWVWAVTRYQDVKTMLSSPDFSSDGRTPGFPAIKPELRALLANPPFVRTDPPEHTSERRPLIPEFTLRRVQELRPGVERATSELLDGMQRQGPPADLVEMLALPLPSLVICQLLGVPYSDHEFFQARARVLISQNSSPGEATTAISELFGYMDQLLTSKQRNPADDLMSRLATEHMEPAGELNRDRVLRMCALLLNAGHETTANMIALGTVVLLQNPDQQALLRESPDRLVAELLRYLSIADLVPARIAVRDTELGGAAIRAGEGAIALLAGANWDPETFDEPDRFQVRPDDQRHLAFGYGVHQCLGANLARMELEVVLPALFERLPTLRLDTPAANLDYKHDGVVYGLHRLPVTWEDTR